MFDTLQAFMRLVGDFKTLDKDTSKMYVSPICYNFNSRPHSLTSAAFSCIGDLMAVFGSQVRGTAVYSEQYS